MVSKEREFFAACARGELEKVKSLSTQVDVNWENPDSLDRTGFHIACYNDKEEVACFLLSLKGLDVNKRDRYGQTAVFRPCAFGHEEILKMIVGDGRVDFNKEDQDGATPLWAACYHGMEVEAKRVLASGRAVDTTKRTKRGDCYGANTTAAGVARMHGLPRLAELIEEYEMNPRDVAQRLRQELNWPTPAALVFSQMIFLCDGLLTLSDEPSPARRFFSIASRLHLDLQLLLANRSQGLAENNVPAADRELAFTGLARVFLQN